MVSKTYLIALLSLASLIPTDLPAQDSGCTRRTVAVGVVDREWNLVSGLSAANFHGSLRGHDVEILSASIDRSPRHIVLLLDASGSMMHAEEAERSISEYLIRYAPPQASIAQMAFSGRVFASEGFSQDSLTLLKNLADLLRVREGRSWGSGKTALYDGIASARGSLGVPNLGDVVFALTDGGDNNSRLDDIEVKKDMLAAGVRLFATIILASKLTGEATPPEGIEGPGHLHDMVAATGGSDLTLPNIGASQPFKYLHIKSSVDAVNLALQRMFQQMGEFYRLDVRTPATVEKPTKWKLEVIDASGRPMRGVEVHYPQELMPCPNVGS